MSCGILEKVCLNRLQLDNDHNCFHSKLTMHAQQLADILRNPLIGRIVMPIFMSAGVTLLCFQFMQMLVSKTPSALELQPIHISAPLHTPLRQETPREVRKKPDRIMPGTPPAAADALPVDYPIQTVVRADYLSWGSLADELDDQILGFEFPPPISDLISLRVVQPLYPLKASMRDIEGYVLVEFTVRENGTVVNPIVLESEPGHIFDSAALKAIQKFRYQPRKMGEIAYQTSGIKLKFTFELTMDRPYRDGISLEQPVDTQDG